MTDVKVKTFVGKSLHDWEFEMSVEPNVEILAELLVDRLESCNATLYSQQAEILSLGNLETYYKTAILTRAAICQRKPSGNSFGTLTSDQRNALTNLVLTDGLKLITDSLGYVQDDERSYKFLPTATISDDDFNLMMKVSRKLELFKTYGLGAQKGAMLKDHNGRDAVMTNLVDGENLVGSKDVSKDGTDLVLAYVLGLSVKEVKRNDLTDKRLEEAQAELAKLKDSSKLLPFVNDVKEVPWADAVLAETKSIKQELSGGGWLI